MLQMRSALTFTKESLHPSDYAGKRFDQALHDKYDPPARKAVTDWIQMKWGLECRENPNVYGVDLIVYREGNPVGFVEVEVRSWSFCHHPTIHIAHRKAKLFQQDRPVLFFALTQDLSHAYWMKAELVKECPLVEVKNREVPNGEFFFDVPISHFKYVDLTELF
jgi:hypothetical protein